MSRFGWAYVNSSITGAVANGPTNSVQFNSGSQVLSGSSNFTFDPSTNKVTLLGQLTGSTLVISASVVSASTYLGITGGGSTPPGGTDQTIQFNSGSTFSGSNNLKFDYSTNTLHLTGTLRADNLIVSSSQILKSGSTIFGDDISDTHQFTGSILGGIVSGTIARFIAITGSTVTGSDAKFTTITGSSIQTSGISLTGALLMSGTSGQAYISEVDYIDFDVSASIPAYKLGRMYYDTDTTDLAYYLTYANQKLQLGQQTVVKVKNSTGSPIAKGKLVHITGGVGDNPLINTASWENDNNSANTLGMLMSTVADGAFGYALLNGVMSGVNTDPATYSEGQVLYLSSSGDYTNVTPIAPNHTVRLGQVIRAHAVVGSVFIKIDNGYEVGELHDVLITSASTGDILTYNSSSTLWTNSKSLSGSYSVTGSWTVTNTISASTGQFTNLTASAISANSVPAFGPNQAIQFNNAGVLNGSSNLTFDGTQVRITGSIQVVSGSTIVTEMLASGVRTTGKPVQVRNASSNLVGVIDENGTVSGSIGRFGIVTGSVVTGSTALFTTISGTNVFSSLDVIASQDLRSNFSSGDEGGQIFLNKPVTNTNITGGVNIDIYQNRLRIFETSGSNRGGYVDLTSLAAGVNTNLAGFTGYAIYTGSFNVPISSYFVGISTTGSVVTASLNSAADYIAGKTLVFKDIGGNARTNNIRIQPSGSQTIDGVTGGVVIASNSGSITLVSNGTNQFYIVGMI